VPSTLFDVIVFDFDGTLVSSAAAKRQAFFEVFPAHCAPAVDAVLARDPDGSRHKVIPEMITEAARRRLEVTGLEARELVAAYTARSASAVAAAQAMPWATAVLERAAAQTATYIASTTPHDELRDLLARRGWHRLVRGAFGFPHRKADVVAMLLARHRIAAPRLLVVGDASGDREAAQLNGCAFHHIEGPHSLLRVPGLGDEAHV
jgi:phosphoglycolate phosphatase-like HAD superfamily hydrolase